MGWVATAGRLPLEGAGSFARTHASRKYHIYSIFSDFSPKVISDFSP
jgi:hypothetical protein